MDTLNARNLIETSMDALKSAIDIARTDRNRAALLVREVTAFLHQVQDGMGIMSELGRKALNVESLAIDMLVEYSK